MKKVHLGTLTGSGAYCGVWNGRPDREPLKLADKTSEVTCLRCLRRMRGLPINHKMKP